MNYNFEEFYNGDPEIMSLITEAIQKKLFVMIHYKPKSNLRKTENYIILPIRFQLISSKGTLVLMLLAKQPSKRMRIIQFIFNKVYAVKFYNPDSNKNNPVGLSTLAVDSVKSRKSFENWGHFLKSEKGKQ